MVALKHRPEKNDKKELNILKIDNFQQDLQKFYLDYKKLILDLLVSFQIYILQDQLIYK